MPPAKANTRRGRNFSRRTPRQRSALTWIGGPFSCPELGVRADERRVERYTEELRRLRVSCERPSEASPDGVMTLAQPARRQSS
jgi:hypothetical protein